MRRRFLLWLLLLLIPLAFLGLAAYYLLPRHPRLLLSHREHKAATGDSLSEETINILIIGRDARAIGPVENEGRKRQKREAASHSDIMIIAHLHLRLGRLHLVALPRDLLVEVPGITAADSSTDFNRMEKLTHVYAIGGEKLLRRTIERLLGITIHHYIAFDFDTFRMTFSVLSPLLGRLHISGTPISDPDQALFFARRRKGLAEDDLDRCRNALLFIRTIVNHTWWLADTRLGSVLMKKILDIVGPDTDLSLQEIEAFSASLRQAGFQPAQIRTAVLAGEGAEVTLLRYNATLSCYLPAYSEIKRQVAHYLLDQDTVKAVSFMTREKFRAPAYLFGNYVLEVTADTVPTDTIPSPPETLDTSVQP